MPRTPRRSLLVPLVVVALAVLTAAFAGACGGDPYEGTWKSTGANGSGAAYEIEKTDAGYSVTPVAAQDVGSFAGTVVGDQLVVDVAHVKLYFELRDDKLVMWVEGNEDTVTELEKQ